MATLPDPHLALPGGVPSRPCFTVGSLWRPGLKDTPAGLQLVGSWPPEVGR